MFRKVFGEDHIFWNNFDLTLHMYIGMNFAPTPNELSFQFIHFDKNYISFLSGRFCFVRFSAFCK